MAQKEFVIDTHQLERLSSELMVLPRGLSSAMRSSLNTGINFSLRKIVTEYYALNPKKIASTYRVRMYRDSKDGYASLRYEVVGRRLTLTHFKVSPFLVGQPRPMIEVVKGQSRQASSRLGADGKRKTPFVMPTGAKRMDAEHINVFRHTGVFSGKKERVEFDSAQGHSVFMARRQGLASYRTVSVPQMLGHKEVSKKVQEELLYQFDRVLFKRIENATGIVQDNITSG